MVSGLTTSSEQKDKLMWNIKGQVVLHQKPAPGPDSFEQTRAEQNPAGLNIDLSNEGGDFFFSFL